MSARRQYYWSLKFLSLFGLLLATFALPHVLPGPPLPLYEGWQNNTKQREHLIATYGFDRPLPVQYIIWMQRLVTGQWGASRFHNQPVFRHTLQATGSTLLLLMWTTLAYGMWVVALKGAQHILCRLGITPPRGERFRFLGALPNFLMAVILHDVAIWQLGWISFANVALFFPYYVFNPLAMLFPASALALTPFMIRYASSRPTLFTQGISPWRNLGLHWRTFCPLFRPLLGIFLMEVLLTEYVFGLPGLGSFGVTAMKRRDFPALQGFILSTGCLYAVLLVILDWGANGIQSDASWQKSPHHTTLSVHRTAYGGTWGIIVLFALAMWAPHLWPYDPTEIHTYDQLLLPSARYIFGTDFLGRDVLSRTIEGFHNSIPRIALITVLTAGTSWLLFGLSRLLPTPVKMIWSGGLALFEALPPFLLAFITFLVVEHLSWTLEIALTIACLPTACKLTAFRRSLSHQIAILACLGELALLLEVSFFYLNLSPESLASTWGSDIRLGARHSHINIWLLLTPTLAIVWSRYIFHQLNVHGPCLHAETAHASPRR
jgi:peptide/nickel transport system permease protein